jgi:hypothetical protein
VVAVATFAGACGGDDDDAAPAGSVTPATETATGPPATVHVSADEPSSLSRMVCEDEDVGAGVEYYTAETLTARPVPTWIDRTYTCAYVLADGTLTLSVKELDDVAGTDTYFAGLKASLGDAGKIYLGDDAFATTTDSVVVRKDNLVLLVDSSTLADHPSPRSRGEVAVNVATIIMACWVGEG